MYTDANSLTEEAQAPIWDRDNALARLGGDEGILKQIVAVYLKETNKGFVLLEKAIEEKNCENVHIYSHALKGSAANMSAYAFIKIAQRMEDKTRINDMSTMQEDFENLKVELKRLLTELNTYVQA